MANYTGQLRSNEIFSAIYNMIISQQVFADNIKGTYSSLADKFRVDGTLYGDTKLYYATDALKSAAWGKDAAAASLLALNRPDAPKCQAVTISNFRQIALTVDNYLSKRAFSTEGTFSEFNSVMLGWIRDTKKVYDSTTVNAFVGTEETSTGQQTRTITLPTDENDAEAQNRLQAQFIAKDLADLLVSMKDVSRDYNDYEFLRSYEPSDLMIIWNADVKNKITKMDLPTIFHKDGLFENVEEVVLPSRYFGTVNTSSTAGKADKTVRSLIEQDITVGSVTKHYFAGDAIVDTTYSAPANTSYTVKPKILYKVVHKRAVPFMSAFEVGTSFFNPKSLTENHYLTFGHSDLTHLENYPFITVYQA